MVTGRPLLGKRVAAALRVWFYNLEDPRDELLRRFMAACQFHGISEADIGGRLFLDLGREQELIIAKYLRGDVLIQVPVVEAIIEEITRHQIDVLVVDPFVDCHHVPENDNGAINEVSKEWAKAASATHSAVELIHHTRKGNGEATTIDLLRGAGSFVNKAQRSGDEPHGRGRSRKVRR